MHTGKTAYEMFCVIERREGLDKAWEWATANLTDGEIEAMEAYQKVLAKAKAKNWHVQPFAHL